MRSEEKQDKRMIAVCILNILQTETGRLDENGNRITMTMKQLGDRLLEKFDITAERKAISNNLRELCYLSERHRGFAKICYRTERKETRGGTIECMTDFYVERRRRFSDGEISTLVDHIKYDKNLSGGLSQRLICKLEQLGGRDYKSTEGRFDESGLYSGGAEDFFDRLTEVNRAIKERRQLSFYENDYGIDKLLHKCSDSKTVFSPYQTVVSRGRYFVIGTVFGERKLSHFRIDKMSSIVMLNEEADRAFARDVSSYLSEHPYMYEGEFKRARIFVNEEAIGIVVDEFGSDISISIPPDAAEERVEVNFRANEEDLFRWALMHGDKVEIISPQSVRDKIRAISRQLRRTYTESEEDFYHIELERAKRGTSLRLVGIDLSERREHFGRNAAAYITLEDNNIDQISFLKDYKRARRIRIVENPVRSIEPLRELEGLRGLELIRTEVSDLTPIVGLKDMRMLVLMGNEQLTDLTPIYSLTKLEYLITTKEEASRLNLNKLRECCPSVDVVYEDYNDLPFTSKYFWATRELNTHGLYPFNLFSRICHATGSHLATLDPLRLESELSAIEGFKQGLADAISAHWDDSFRIFNERISRKRLSFELGIGLDELEVRTRDEIIGLSRDERILTFIREAESATKEHRRKKSLPMRGGAIIY